MINFLKYDVIVVRFPFASSLKYKARPAVVISSIATIEKDSILGKLGSLSSEDIQRLEKMIEVMC
ncbi:MAG: hypothetical protein AB7D96_01185 [Arcobacteraceae bacterium]